MYVCSCRAVSDRTVRAAVAAGAASIGDIAARCGAGSGCGGCWPTLERLLAEAGAVRAGVDAGAGRVLADAGAGAGSVRASAGEAVRAAGEAA
jgi:bacterioferritin-associated ferredoxin